jgi:hypothetical protein
MTSPIPYEQRRDAIVSEILRASGDSDVEMTRIVQDAADNAYVEGITDADWLAAMRQWAYELRHKHTVRYFLGAREAGVDGDRTKAVRDAVTSTYIEGITNNDWVLRPDAGSATLSLHRIGPFQLKICAFLGYA